MWISYFIHLIYYDCISFIQEEDELTEKERKKLKKMKALDSSEEEDEGIKIGNIFPWSILDASPLNQ